MRKSHLNVRELLELEARHDIKDSIEELIIEFSTVEELDLLSYLQKEYH